MEKTKKWCDASLARCRLNAEEALTRNLKPDGYDGLSKQIAEATRLLTFVPDDRGPQILHACCSRWYKAMLGDTSLFQECLQAWPELRQAMYVRITELGFTPTNGWPYLYGIFKAKKRRWRPISGACTDKTEGGLQGGKPAHPMSAVHVLLTRGTASPLLRVTNFCNPTW